MMLRAMDQARGFAVTTCLVLLCIVVFAGVVARYVFNDSFTWTEEIGQLLFAYIIFLGIPLAHRQRAHIAIDLLPGHLPAAVRPGIAFLVDLVLAYTTFALMVFGYDLMLLIGGMSPALEWPSRIKYAVIPLRIRVKIT